MNRLPRKYIMVQVDEETRALFLAAAGALKLGLGPWLRLLGIQAAERLKKRTSTG